MRIIEIQEYVYDKYLIEYVVNADSCFFRDFVTPHMIKNNTPKLLKKLKLRGVVAISIKRG